MFIAAKTKSRLTLCGAVLVATGAVLLAPVLAANTQSPRSLATTAAVQTNSAGNDSTPSASQFLYLKIQFGSGQVGEFWLSIDGTHDGLMNRPDLGSARIPLPGCINGKQALVRGNDLVAGQSVACRPQPAYDPKLPTDAAGFSALLKSDTDGGSSSEPARRAKNVATILEFSWLSSAQRAALVQAASLQPGLVVADVTTEGIPAVRISWQSDTDPSENGALLLSENDYQFMGFEGSDRILTRAVVNSAGETP
jgi:hypothetical protein